MPAYYEKYENLAFTRDARTIRAPGRCWWVSSEASTDGRRVLLCCYFSSTGERCACPACGKHVTVNYATEAEEKHIDTIATGRGGLKEESPCRQSREGSNAGARTSTQSAFRRVSTSWTQIFRSCRRVRRRT